MTALDVVAWLTGLLFAAVAVDGVHLWRRHRSEAAAWMVAAFTALGGAILLGRVLPPRPAGPAAELAREVVLVAVLAFPYLLYRFTAALARRRDRAIPVLTAFTALLLGLSVALSLPAPGEAVPAWYRPYVALVLLYWTVLAVVVAGRLWHAGAGQPTPARRRMRTLAVASIALNVALLLAGSTAGEQAPFTLALLTQVTAGVSGALFAVGFSPPAPLRALWRRPEGSRLRAAERGLMVANSSSEVAAGLLPPLAQLLGGEAAALYAADGRLLGRHGSSPVATPPQASDGADRGVEVWPDRVVLRFEHGTAVVHTSPYTPLFGADEVELAQSLATLVDLALGRVELLDRERLGAAELERTNAELQTLLYGLSHDLRNPLLTMVGYVDLLAQGHGGSLDADGQRFVERIARSARYMDALIRDLLELSRVGRVHTETEPVDLTEVVREAADEVRAADTRASVTVEPLGAVSMSPVRARQLFANLLQNAVRHGGRDDIAVTVRSERAEDGSLCVSVSDNGVGVPEEYRERLFGLFERMESGLGAGTGIGLAICRKIMEQLGGTIALAEAAEGADVRLRFPARSVLPDAVLESRS